ncbi:MAG TPA: 50S ribosome-binding GTPase, partial [Pirellulaceae bacterium]|nr:50S ribosome-binding GTPase [Pirellulaceae bacterium]
MTRSITREQLAESCDQLAAALAAPRSLEIDDAHRVAIEQALARVRAQLLGGDEAALVVALVGGTGVGKSTLINALAGSTIAEATGRRRPVTSRITVYHHRDLPAGNLPVELGAAADFIVHDRHELRHKVIVDTPDLDSLRSEHRVVTKALLKAAHLAIYVFEPRRYNDERVWSVLRTEEQFSACAAVLNKTNDRERLQSVEELQDVAADLRHLLGTIGQRDCPLFCLSADAHLASGPLSPAPPLVDQFDDFRDFLERCLEDSDIARRIRAQRERVVAHLEQQIAAALPPALTDNVERLSTAASDATGELLPRLERQLNDPLTAVDQQLADLFRWRSLDRFHGPFHYWLLSWALLGLAVRRAFQTLSMGVVPLWSSRDPERQQGWIGQILRSGGEAEVSQAFRDAAQVVQNELFSQRLPISRWRNLVADFQPGAWLDRVAQDIQRAFEVQALLGQQRKGVSGAICWTVSVIGGVVPAGLLGLGLWGMIQELYAGRYLGFDLLGHLLAVIALLFVMLQIVVSVLVPRTAERLRGLTRDALRSATDQVFIRWGEKYRADLQSDVAALREPLRIVRAALNARLTTSSRDVDRPLSLPKPKQTPVAAS